MDIGKKKKLMNCRNVLNKGSSKYVQSYKNNILKESIKDSLLTTKITNNTLPNKNKSSTTNKNTLKSSLSKVNQQNLEQSKKNNEEEIEKYPEVETFGRNDSRAEALHANQKEDRNTVIQRAKKTMDSSNQEEYKRVTIITKKDDKNFMIQQKLRPSVIGNEYYYQTVEDIVKNGQRSVSVITKSDRGQIISVQ